MNYFKNRTILITGGTGSFGNAFVDLLIKKKLSFKEVRIFSRDEKKQEDMRLTLKDRRIKFYIGDVRDLDSVDQASQGVDFIFHAAALKQVPTCEFYPMEAINTNIHGAENVMKAAIKNRVKRVILLSTDKAVYPVNAMGISKAMMERLMLAKARECKKNDTIFCATRYGNVMLSRGSVIPLFINQIKHGKPLTVTDPNMTRFLMSLEDSIDLVTHAFEHGKQGDILVQKTPAATIGDLAKCLKELFKVKNKIIIIGTRHGEKLYETLLSREEMFVSENNGRFYRIPMDNRDLNYDKYFSNGKKNISLCNDYTSHSADRLNIKELKKIISKLNDIKKVIND